MTFEFQYNLSEIEPGTNKKFVKTGPLIDLESYCCMFYEEHRNSISYNICCIFCCIFFSDNLSCIYAIWFATIIALIGVIKSTYVLVLGLLFSNFTLLYGKIKGIGCIICCIGCENSYFCCSCFIKDQLNYFKIYLCCDKGFHYYDNLKEEEIPINI